jgi:thioredoxin 1
VSTAILALTESTFDEAIMASPVPVVVEFWAEWCPPCKLLAPILDSIAADYSPTSTRGWLVGMRS